MTTGQWSPVGGQAGIALLGFSTPGKLVSIPGDVFADALLDTLVRAETLVVGGIQTEGGMRPVGAVGEGRKLAMDEYLSGNPARGIVYLGAHGAVRLAHEQARRGTPQMGALPLAATVALTVVGLAAIASTAWYAKERHATTVQMEGQTAKAIVTANAAATMASSAIAAGQPIPKEAVEALAGLAKYEVAQGSILWPMATAAACTVAVGAVAFAAIKGRKGRRGS